jgi:lipid-binding SYLF domain-containing protein
VERRAQGLNCLSAPASVASPPLTMMRDSRGNFRMTGKTFGIALIAAFMLLAANGLAKAASAGEINASVNATLDRFYRQIPGARELSARAAGVLVFPTVLKAGFGVGGEYGEGAMRVGGKTVGYYNTISASFGFQLGAQARSVIIMFMTPEALAGFRRVEGFKVGVDGSVAIIVVGAGGSIDTDKVTSPVIGFILDPKGLMYNLTLEGSKITRISR